MTERPCLAVILAAGEGTRMKSARAKVLHPVAGKAMVLHVLDTARAAGISERAVVVGRDAATVRDAVNAADPEAQIFEQAERLGTGHAVLAAREALEGTSADVLVLFGDAPLMRAETLAKARAALADGADVAVIGFRTNRPTGYGRLIVEKGELVAIREEKDASAEEREITLCNGGAMAIAGGKALPLLDAIGNDNAKGEYYLTDIVEIARSRGGRAVAVEADFEESMGVNNRAELAAVEAEWQRRRRHEMMFAGVTMTAPETVFLSCDTVLEADVIVEPHVVFGPGVTVAAGAKIRAFSHLEGAFVAANAEVGPYARLRPGAKLAEGSKVGNFCEVKKAEIGPGAKVNHLTYIGDAEIGAKANIGAGTITCNYDGINKHLTKIGAGVFVGSNSSLVAPVTIGDGAYIASGSVITEDVAADALAFGRARQAVKEGRAREVRARNAALKASKTER
jgi:bifunctional UDP-N-acetylglucosamine pyrophosphorylase/glucosamine-1-phosphate N-acetyltransferase